MDKEINSIWTPASEKGGPKLRGYRVRGRNFIYFTTPFPCSIRSGEEIQVSADPVWEGAVASGKGQHCPAEDAQGETGVPEALYSPQARRIARGEFLK